MSTEHNRPPRMRSRSRSPTRANMTRQIPLFPLIIAVPSEIASLLLTNDTLHNIYKESGIQRIHIAQTPNIESFNSSLVYIYDDQIGKVMHCFRLVNYIQILLQFLNGESEHTRTVSIRIFVPEKLVAMVIGYKGGSINKIQDSTGTFISILEKIAGIHERSIKIDGKIKSIESAVDQIYRVIIEPKRKLNEKKKEHTSSLCFVIPETCSGYVIGKHGMFTKRINHEFNVELKVTQATGPPCKEMDDIAVSANQTLTGKHEDCKDAIPIILEKILDALTNVSAKSEGTVKLLIPTAVITRLNESRKCNIGSQFLRKVTYKVRDADVTFSPSSDPSLDQSIIVVNGPSYDCKRDVVLAIFKELDNTGKTTIRKRNNEQRRPEDIKDKDRSRRERESDRDIRKKRSDRDFEWERERDRTRLGDGKVVVHLAVPERHVARLIGRNGTNIGSMMDKARCRMSFQDKVQDRVRIRTPDGGDARLCKFQGTSTSVSNGVRLMIEMMTSLEEV